MLVTDRRLAGGEDALLRAVDASIEGGVNVVQLREKDLPPADLLSLACRMREVTKGRAAFLVNGPLEVALQAGADGVHLPEDAPPPPAPWPFTWGRSVHSMEGAITAIGEGARHIIIGPIFQTQSHPDGPPLGLDVIRELAPVTRCPIIAIGGITPGNARGVMQAGAHGIAVIRAILESDDPKTAAQALSKSWELVPVRKEFP
jgi:thiamine-phosphate diphosphorylase